ncbi:hypothetical protein [Microbispora sp. KK1-11]|nr:hypothetical protein [Microbispora sp. KK1-11]
MNPVPVFVVPGSADGRFVFLFVFLPVLRVVLRHRIRHWISHADRPR